MSLLGLDVGTTGCKAVAFNLEGVAIASSYREYPLYSPKPGWQELDPEEVWAAIRTVLAETAAKAAHDPIQAMAVSAQGEACHPVDDSGNCLARSIVTFDARTADYPARWEKIRSRFALAQITGMPLHGMYSLNKIMWWREHDAAMMQRAKKVHCYEDFVHRRLGLEPVMSHSLAARTMAFDIVRGDWSDEVLGLAGESRELLAKTAPSGTIVGTIPDKAAAALGLPRGIVVATGGHDQPAGALGAGILEPGEAMYATGTVECICPIFESRAITEETVANNLCCYPACVPGLYASIAFNFTGGSLLKWYRDTFAQDERRRAQADGRDVYDLLCDAVPQEPEKLLVLPHFTVTGTPDFDTRSRGVIAGLTLETTRPEVVSAILSGVTFEMKRNLELLQHSGVQIRRLRASGGGARSAVWVQRKANILGLPVAVLGTPETPALGVAFLAGHAAGLIPDLKAAIQQAVKIEAVFEPDPAGERAYASRYAIYKDLYPAVRDVCHRLAELN